jgi:hypothetical protein
VIAAGQRRGRFDGRDADDGLAEPLLVGADLGGQVGDRRFVTQREAQLLSRGLELAANAPDATWPGILAKRIDHGPAYSALGERFELDPTSLIEAMRRIDETDDAVLNQVA